MLSFTNAGIGYREAKRIVTEDGVITSSVTIRFALAVSNASVMNDSIEGS